MLQHNALESSIFEGASCLHAEKVAKVAKAAKDKAHVEARSRLPKAAAKKAVKGKPQLQGVGSLREPAAAGY